jgi:hypothetical protein
MLGAIRPILVITNIGLQFCNLLFRILKLLRKRLRHLEGLFALLLGCTGCSLQQSQKWSAQTCRVDRPHHRRFFQALTE